MKRLLLAEAIVGAAATLLFEIFPVQLISLFGSDNPPLYFAFAKLAFRLYLCLMTLDCVNKASFIQRSMTLPTPPTKRHDLHHQKLKLLLPVWNRHPSFI